MSVESKFIQYIKENRVADAMDVIKEHLDSHKDEIKGLAKDYVAEHHYGMVKEKGYKKEEEEEKDKDDGEKENDDEEDDDKEKDEE